MKLEQRLEYAQQIVDFLKAGGALTYVEGRPPRKEEKTFPVTRGSIAHNGVQSTNLKLRGYRAQRV